MKRIRRALIAVALLVLVLVAVPLVRDALSPRKQQRPEGLPPPGVDMRLDKVHYEQIDQDGRREWELFAKAAQYEKDNKKVALSSINVSFFSKEGAVYKLSADRGELCTESQDVSLTGNVVAETAEGYSIRTDSIKYVARDRKVSTADPVSVSSKEMVMTGRGMVIDLEAEKLYILEEVKASGNQ
jgi:LPS export ABC transporter protein LptC